MGSLEVQQEASNILKSLNSLVALTPEAVSDFVDHLKSIRVKIRASPSSLRIDNSLENLINERMKDVLWLMNLSKCPFLLQPETITLTQDVVPPPFIEEAQEGSSNKIS